MRSRNGCKIPLVDSRYAANIGRAGRAAPRPIRRRFRSETGGMSQRRRL